MRKFYHQKKIEIENRDEFQTQEFSLNIPNTYGFNYYEALDVEIQEFFNGIEDSEDPTLFRITGDFSLLQDADQEEKLYFIVAVVNIFVSHMIYSEDLEREKRLAAPKSIDSLNLNMMTKKSIVNKKIKFPIFSIEVLDINGEVIYEVFNNEDTNNNPN